MKLALCEATVVQPYDICQSYSGRRIYLDSNERGFLRTNNTSSSTYKNVFEKKNSLNSNLFRIHRFGAMKTKKSSTCFEIEIEILMRLSKQKHGSKHN